MKPVTLTNCNILGCSSIGENFQNPHPVILTGISSYALLGSGKHTGLIFSENLTGSGSLMIATSLMTNRKI